MRQEMASELRASLGLRIRDERGRPSKGKISQPSEKFDRQDIYINDTFGASSKVQKYTIYIVCIGWSVGATKSLRL